MSCPPSYETYINMIKPSHVQYEIWFYFRKTTDRSTAKCKECDQIVRFDGDTIVLVDHLKDFHYSVDASDFRYSYENYIHFFFYLKLFYKKVSLIFTEKLRNP